MSRIKWVAAPNQHFRLQHFLKKITEKEFYNNQYFQSHNCPLQWSQLFWKRHRSN